MPAAQQQGTQQIHEDEDVDLDFRPRPMSGQASDKWREIHRVVYLS
jgi:hypothetical protein